MGVEVFNKTLGIIGLGAIGGQVAKKAQGLEMNVIAYDPFLSEDKAQAMGIKKGSLDEIFAESDFITIHAPMTPETKGLINASTIAKMKHGVRIINCARGGIIHEKDLFEAIKNGKVAGAALDVFEKEPPEDNPLLTLDNLICTPHLGASTEEAQENVALAIAEQIADYLVHGTIRHAVNFPSIPSDQVPRLQPYIDLAEKLGSYCCQIFEGGATEITVEYLGDASTINTAPVTIAAIKGYLSPILLETVNFVNAPFIAKERGIDVKETKSSDAGDFHSKITIRIKAKNKESYVSGTLYSKGIDFGKCERAPQSWRKHGRGDPAHFFTATQYLGPWWGGVGVDRKNDQRSLWPPDRSRCGAPVEPCPVGPCEMRKAYLVRAAPLTGDSEIGPDKVDADSCAPPSMRMISRASIPAGGRSLYLRTRSQMTSASSAG